jgi:membrane protease YdiL (CAAX protease family)
MTGEKHAQTSWCILLFTLVFLTWQIADGLFQIHIFATRTQHLLCFTLQVSYICAALLFIKIGYLNFQERGFCWPHQRFYINLAFVASLALIIRLLSLFLLGSIIGEFEAYPPVSLNDFLLGFLRILFTSLASQFIFLGCIQSTLTKRYGFSLALFVSSMMFTIYRIPLLSHSHSDYSFILNNILLPLMMGIFLGFLFHKTKTLVYPLTFYMVNIILISFTPLTIKDAELIPPLFEAGLYSFLMFIVNHHFNESVT